MLKSEIATQLHQHIQSFFVYFRTRCMADGTIEGYGNNLRQFAELLGALPGSKTLTDFKEACTESILLETVVVRQGSNPDLSAHTIRRYISAWRSWVRYLVKIDVLDIAYDRFKQSTCRYWIKSLILRLSVDNLSGCTCVISACSN